MAKKSKSLLVRLKSTESGYFFIKKRNPKTSTKKLSFKKYDPVLRKHVVYNEEKSK